MEVLKVEHIIVCGHYGCGGVLAAMKDKQYGLIDNWLREIKDIYQQNWDKLKELPEEKRADKLIELNVLRSAQRLCQTSIVQNAWAKGQELSVHTWCYRLQDGLLQDLKHVICNANGVDDIYRFSC